MKASQVVDPRKKSKERPDLEEAIDESDSGMDSGEDEAVLDDDEPLDLKKDKYVAAPKKKKAAKKASAKGKGKVKNEDDDDDESEEEVKPQKSARGKGRAKK